MTCPDVPATAVGYALLKDEHETCLQARNPRRARASFWVDSWHEEVAMRIVACGLIAGAALLGPVPAAAADAPVTTANADSQAAPQTEVSMLALSLTVGGAVATAGSGVALALNRRRAISRQPSRVSG